MRTMIIAGIGIGDEIFENDIGKWNVTKAKMHCAAGLHQRYLFDTEPCYEASKNIEIEQDKMDALTVDDLQQPLVLVMRNGKAYLIDGRHRLEWLHRNAIDTFIGFVIEEEHEPKYRVEFTVGEIA